MTTLHLSISKSLSYLTSLPLLELMRFQVFKGPVCTWSERDCFRRNVEALKLMRSNEKKRIGGDDTHGRHWCCWAN